MPAGTPAKWIWNFDSRNTNVGGTVYFRRAYTVPSGATAVTIAITADDEFDLYVDGALIGSGNWWYSTRFFLVSATPGSTHQIAVEVRNSGGGLGAPLSGGLIVDIRGSGGSGNWCR